MFASVTCHFDLFSPKIISANQIRFSPKFYDNYKTSDPSDVSWDTESCPRLSQV